MTVNDLPEGVPKTCRNLLIMRLVERAIADITADPQLASLWIGTVVYSGFGGYLMMDNNELLDEAIRVGLSDLPTLAEL
jgi:hypothetical protein